MLEYFNLGIKQVKKPFHFYLRRFYAILNNAQDSFGPLEATFHWGNKNINLKRNRCAKKDQMSK